MAAILLMTRRFHDLAFSQEVKTNALAPRIGVLILYVFPTLLPIYYMSPPLPKRREKHGFPYAIYMQSWYHERMSGNESTKPKAFSTVAGTLS